MGMQFLSIHALEVPESPDILHSGICHFTKVLQSVSNDCYKQVCKPASQTDRKQHLVTPERTAP